MENDERDERLEAARRLRNGLVWLLFSAVSGVAGYVFLCGWPVFDAIYMFIITISSIGFGEIRHENNLDRVVTIFVICTGLTSTAYVFGSFLQMLTEGQLRRILAQRMTNQAIEGLRDHHIICGFGRMGLLLCEELYAKHEPFVLVERDAERLQLAEQSGFLHVQGDATLEEVLTLAGITRAKSIICVLPSDADNVFVTLTARQMNRNLFIAARAEQLSTEKKLLQAGADRVVSPAVIGAQRLCNMLTRPTAIEVLELVSGKKTVDLEMLELQVDPTSSLVGQSLADAKISSRTGVMIVAVKRKEGQLTVGPEGATILRAGDTVVVLGRSEHIDAFRKLIRS